jgi:uncharacterized membrane-anchored protein YitT (DUF2179 family)
MRNITDVRHTLKNALLILVGIGCATIGLKGFLIPNHFLDGGVTGISLLTYALSGVSVSLLLIVINLPFIIMGARQLSLSFAIKTALAIGLLALVLNFIEFPILTEDKLLIAVFGGFFLGAGIGFAIRGGCVIDGTEVLAIYISRRSSLSVGDVIAVFNIVLFSVSALLVSLETALYSMLTYFAASKTVDFIIHGIEEYTGVTIISEKADDVKNSILYNLGRGVTVIHGESAYGKKGVQQYDRKVLFSVVTRLEVQKLIHEVQMVDPNAFVIQHTINDTVGGMVKRRPFHK